MTTSLLRRALCVAALLAAVAAPSRIDGQTPTNTTFRACFVPLSGTLYLIAVTGAPAACAKSTHQEITFNQTGPEGPAGPAGATGPAGGAGPCTLCVDEGSIKNGAVTNDKLGTITAAGKIANSATTATASNTPGAIVARDNNGSFQAASVSLPATGRILVGGASLLFHHRPLGDAASIFVGFAGHPETTGGGNVGIGESALGNVLAGGGNIGIGALAGADNVTGTDNVAIGSSAFREGRGDANIAIGRQALAGLSTGRGNIAIGHLTGIRLGTGDDNIYVGTGGPTEGVAESNTIRIGSGTQSRTFIDGIHEATTIPSASLAVFVENSGRLGTGPGSSARVKRDVRDLGSASATLYQLRPVSFRYLLELDPAGSLQYGLIAEEVVRIAPELAVRDSAGRIVSVRYDQLVPMLLNELQRLEQRLSRLEAALKP